MTLTVSDAATYVQKPVNVIYTQTLLRNARPLCPYMLGTTAGQIARNGGTATIKWRRFDTSLDNSTSGIAPLTSTACRSAPARTSASARRPSPGFAKRPRGAASWFLTSIWITGATVPVITDAAELPTNSLRIQL